MNKSTLEKLLLDAEKAHAKYEKKLGKRDENWAKWYADYMVKKLNKTK